MTMKGELVDRDRRRHRLRLERGGAVRVAQHDCPGAARTGADHHNAAAGGGRRRLRRAGATGCRRGIAGAHRRVAFVPPAIKARRRSTGLNVYGDLGAKALALAEGWLGAARAVRTSWPWSCRTGVEGGIVLNGQLLDGATGNAGHVGHTVVEPNGRRCPCGSRGCLEAEASGPAIEAITGRPPTEPTYEIMQRTGRLVGRAVATVCNLLDLDLAVVGGSVALGFGATFFNSAQETLDEHAAAVVQPQRPDHPCAARGSRAVDRCRRGRGARSAPGRSAP